MVVSNPKQWRKKEQIQQRVNKMKRLDLDNCIFDAEPLYKQAFTRTEYKYYPPKNYWIEEAYPKISCR